MGTSGASGSRGSRRWVAAGAVLCAVVASSSLWIAKWDAGRSVQGLIPDKDALVLGEVWETSDHKVDIPIRNIDTKTISVVDFSSSCGCLSVEPRTFQLAPGATQMVRLRINLMLSQRNDGGAAGKEFTVVLTPVLSDGSVQQQTWTLQGTVKRLLRLSDPRPFIALTVGEDSETVISATATTRMDGLLGSAEPDLANIVVDRDPADVDRFLVRIRPKQSLPPGPLEFSVHLRPHRDGEQLQGVTFVVAGVVRGRISAQPELLHLGGHPVGSTATDDLTLRPTKSTAFTVESITSVAPGIIIRPANSGGAEKRYTISRQIVKEGQQEDTVTFAVRTQDGRIENVPVRVLYIGQPSR